MYRFLWVVIVTLPSLLACVPSGVSVSDDVDFSLNLGLGPAQDTLHQPYAVGASVGMTARDNGRASAADWFAEADSPSLVSVVSQNGSQDALQFGILALARGTSTISIWESTGKRTRLRSVTVNAETAQEIRLFARRPVATDGKPEDTLVETPQVLNGGTAQFMARYFRDNRELFGNQLLAATSDDAVIVKPLSTFLFASRDWVQVLPKTAGTKTITITAGNEATKTWVVQGVEREAVTSVGIRTDPEDQKEDGVTMLGLGTARDAAGQEVFGVSLS